jgi:hypothetical protein
VVEARPARVPYERPERFARALFPQALLRWDQAAASAVSPRRAGLNEAVAVFYRCRVGGSRDDRARQRDQAAAKRDLAAAVRDGLIDEQEMSERESSGRDDARADREAAAGDRRDAAMDRRAAEQARNAARRSGE